MREIKFRVWTGQHLIYQNTNNVPIYDMPGKKELKDFYKDSANIYYEEDDSSDRGHYILKFYSTDLMQYTGLKDKNGKEIYEGDIISYKYYKGFSGIEKEIIAKIEFVNGCFGFYEYKNEYDEYFNRDDLDKTTVIGNVYENPELLKQTED